MNTEEQNYRNRGSLWLLLALILLVGVAIAVYGIIVTSEQKANESTFKTANTFPYVDEALPERLDNMKHIKAIKEELEVWIEDAQITIEKQEETIAEYKELVETMTEDMLELSQTIATRQNF